MKTISNEYQYLISNVTFSNSLIKYSFISDFISTYTPKSIIDYGCARGNIIQKIKCDFPFIDTVDGYDPGVAEFNTLPTKTYECLICNDVLEHIEPELLANTVNTIENLFYKSAWLIIACYPAKKKLADGRNAHLIIESPEWWINFLEKNLKKSKIVFQETVLFSPSKKTKNKPELRLILEKIK